MRGRRGRPPKAQLTQEPTAGPVRGLRPRRGLRAKPRGTCDEDYVTPKRGSHHPATRGRRKVRSAVSRGRGRGRGTARGRGRRSAASGVVYDDHESDEEDEDAVSLRSEELEYMEEPLTDEEQEEEEEEEANDESDYLEELDDLEEDDASFCTESSHGSNTGTGRLGDLATDRSVNHDERGVRLKRSLFCCAKRSKWILVLLCAGKGRGVSS